MAWWKKSAINKYNSHNPQTDIKQWSHDEHNKSFVDRQAYIHTLTKKKLTMIISHRTHDGLQDTSMYVQ